MSTNPRPHAALIGLPYADLTPEERELPVGTVLTGPTADIVMQEGGLHYRYGARVADVPTWYRVYSVPSAALTPTPESLAEAERISRADLASGGLGLTGWQVRAFALALDAVRADQQVRGYEAALLAAERERDVTALAAVVADLRDEIDGLREVAEDCERDGTKAPGLRAHIAELVERADHIARGPAGTALATLIAQAEARGREAERAQTLGIDTPFPLADVLERLLLAADHLHDVHDCDTHGWEVVREVAEHGRRYLAILRGEHLTPTNSETPK